MPRRKAKAPPGAPPWVVTFGDMMSLLLTFFILLQMFSELKQDHEYQRVITAIKDAFGYSGGIGVLPVDDPPVKSMIESLESIAANSLANSTDVSQNDVEGIDGPTVRVRTVAEGMMFTIGGPSVFDPFSAEVNPELRARIEQLAKFLAGRQNKIRIVGHAAAKRLPADSEWESLDDLAFQRALNVQRILLEAGIDDRQFRVESAGTREPVNPRALDDAAASENRRVEVILTEQLVEEVRSDADYTDPDRARGG